jgi:hypothetical protein
MRIGEYDRPDVEDFFTGFQSFLGLLKDIDAAIAEKKSGNLHWRVTTLKKEPMPIVGVTPYVLRKAEDISHRVEKAVFGNLASLNERGEWSRSLPDAALGRVEKIAKMTPKIGSSVIYIDTHAPVQTQSASISRQTLTQLEIIREPKSSAYGTIYGELGSICIRNANEYRVWEEESGRPVVCGFKVQEEQVIKDLLRSQVEVAGTIQYNSNGAPISVRNIENITRRDQEAVPTIEEMVGLVPNFTGGLSLKEFLEDMD